MKMSEMLVIELGVVEILGFVYPPANGFEKAATCLPPQRIPRIEVFGKLKPNRPFVRIDSVLTPALETMLPVEEKGRETVGSREKHYSSVQIVS